MFLQFVIGAGASLISIAIHALVTMLVIRLAHAMADRGARRSSMFLVAVMVPTVAVLMLTHSGEVVVWSLVYLVVGATLPGTPLVYFAFVNYTTLGYGDIIPVREWQLLGPLTAMNGILLFGWSTAVIFEVLREAIRSVRKLASERS